MSSFSLSTSTWAHPTSDPPLLNDQPNDSPGTSVIEVDASEVDSAYGSSPLADDIRSLRSSIVQYKWEHGRRYHAFQDGTYWAPNDDKQQEAEDLNHAMHRVLLDGNLYLAPISNNPQHVLDIGCGTGTWAIDFADEHPSAEVIGVDLSPIQPHFVPANCRFEVDDVNDDWPHPENHFDFVHVRNFTGCTEDWVQFHSKTKKHIKPGGWIEQVELSGRTLSDDDSIAPDSALLRWWDLFMEIGRLTGKSFTASEDMRDALGAAGFVGVHQTTVKLPCGTWPKDKKLKQWGAWNRMFLLDGLEGFALRGLTNLLQWSYDDAQLYLAQVRKELMNPRIHAYFNLRVAYGQKPEEK